MVRQRFWRSEMLFLAAYSLWLVFAAIRLTDLRKIIPDYADLRSCAITLSMILLALKFYVDDRLDLTALAALLVVGLFVVIFRHTEAEQPLYMILFICSMRNVDYKNVFRVSLVIQALVMGLAVVAVMTGLMENVAWSEYGRVRLAYGYSFCTYGAHIAMFMTLTYMSLKRTLKLWQTILLVGFNLLWFLGTNTNTDLYLFMLAVMGCILISLGRTGFSDRRWAKAVFMLAGPVIAGVSLAAQFLYVDSDWRWFKVNGFLNNRLKLGHMGIEEYGITLWGQKIKWVGAGSMRKNPGLIYNYVDCSYLKYLLHYGIVFEILLLIGIVLLGKFVAEQKNPGLQVAFLCWLLFGAIDAELFHMDFQPIMLLLGCVFMSGQREKNTVLKSNMQLLQAGG